MNGIKPVEELKFTDDFMFYKVMQNPEICKELLERLLKIKVEKVEYPELQKHFGVRAFVFFQAFSMLAS